MISEPLLYTLVLTAPVWVRHAACSLSSAGRC
jgi:hypothetical protein